MLLNIVIKNYALIEALNIDLDPGLNVIDQHRFHLEFLLSHKYVSK